MKPTIPGFVECFLRRNARDKIKDGLMRIHTDGQEASDNNNEDIKNKMTFDKGCAQLSFSKMLIIVAICLGVVLLTNAWDHTSAYGDVSCGETTNRSKNENRNLFSEKTAPGIEVQKLKNEISDKDNKITQLKNRISTLMQENTNLRTKYRNDMKVSNQMQEDLREKYEKCRKTIDDKIDALKDRHHGESLIPNERTTTEDLYYQLEQQFKEEIEKGQIKIELHSMGIERRLKPH